MTIAEIQQEIMRMKKEQDVCILAHAYQSQDILEVADLYGRFLWSQCAGFQKQVQRCDYVRCPFYGRNRAKY